MSELPCPYCGFNCEIPSTIEEKIECPNCRSIFMYIRNSKSHGTIDYRPSPEINDRCRQTGELKAILATSHPKMKNACDGAIEVYIKSEADKVIAELEESHKKEVGQLLIEIAELKAQKAQAEDDCAYWKAKAKGEM